MKRALAFIMILFAAFPLTSCGGNEPLPTSIDVLFTEFAFTPVEFTVPAGQEITVHAVNNGAFIHEFIIMKKGTDVTTQFAPSDEENVYWRLKAGIGQEADGTFIAPSEPGDYQIICGIIHHFVNGDGMVGTLHVVAP